jgi:hypothetical protein
MRLLLSLAFVISLSAQAPQEAPKQGGGPPPPKNLKVLKVQGPELIALMRSYTVALGKQCGECHMGRDFASDENPKKEIARQMIVMAQDINAKFPDGKQHVTCYTCHRGDVMPLMAPAAAAPAAQ